MALEITKDAQILVRVPYGTPEQEIQNFMKEKQCWIEKHLNLVKERKKRQNHISRLTGKEIQELANQALERIPKKVEYYALKMNITYGRITIRNQRTRWGSCSSKGNLNFNCLLMLAPPEVLNYVVVHELCHRREMNHSSRFWTEVEKILPDYKEQKRWLKENGSSLMERMFG